MKRCPECRRDYYDDSLLYCLDDGAALLEGPATSAGAVGESATAILNDTTAATRVQTSSEPGRRRSRLWYFLPLLLIAIGGVAFVLIKPLWSGEAKQIQSIAVMPFKNESGTADLEYLSDGITESLINSLSKVPKLAVKARSSVFRYQGKDVTPQQVARDLSVQAVLTGRVVQ